MLRSMLVCGIVVCAVSSEATSQARQANLPKRRTADRGCVKPDTLRAVTPVDSPTRWENFIKAFPSTVRDSLSPYRTVLASLSIVQVIGCEASVTTTLEFNVRPVLARIDSAIAPYRSGSETTPVGIAYPVSTARQGALNISISGEAKLRKSGKFLGAKVGGGMTLCAAPIRLSTTIHPIFEPDASSGGDTIGLRSAMKFRSATQGGVDVSDCERLGELGLALSTKLSSAPITILSAVLGRGMLDDISGVHAPEVEPQALSGIATVARTILADMHVFGAPATPRRLNERLSGFYPTESGDALLWVEVQKLPAHQVPTQLRHAMQRFLWLNTLDKESAVHIVQRGESLSKIALLHYGDEALWPVLCSLNDSIRSMNRVVAGTALRVPPLWEVYRHRAEGQMILPGESLWLKHIQRGRPLFSWRRDVAGRCSGGSPSIVYPYHIVK
jgi:hypothetical protein